MTHGAIASPHSLATAAGKEMLLAGGSAVDASIAAAAVLTVVYPHQCAIGGDLFAVIDHPKLTVPLSFNGSGRSPKSVDPERIQQTYGGVPDSGVDSITVPGVVAGWESLWLRAGKLPWAYIFGPSINIAEQGCKVSRSLAAGIQYRRNEIIKNRGMASIFMKNKCFLKEGDYLYQPQLAKSLRQIAEYGASEFYCGELAKRMVVGLKKLNCDLSEDDFAQHKTEVNTSLTMAFAGHELATSPPNSQGFVLLETLAALESLKIPLDPLGEKSRALLHASLMAAEDRDQYLGDPKTAHIPLSQLLDQTDLAVRLQKRLNKDARQTSFEGEHARGDTVAVCSIDTEGNSISLIQSVYQTFGSVVMEPETGVIFHNRARGFSFNPNASNKYIPNTRPAHTLMPLLIRKNGRTIMSIGTMGGRAQPQILAQVLAGALDEDMKPEDVLRQPRWIVGARDIDFVNLTVAIEADAPSALDNYLAIPGIDLVRIDSCTESVGHTQLVRLSPTNQLEAASDPRADGSASIV